MKHYIFLIFILIFKLNYSQNTCNNPIQLCFTDNSSISYPAQTTGTAQVGPAYGCLTTQPNPTWFYIHTNSVLSNSVTQFVVSASSGTTTIDVDGIIWGPFSSNTGFCSSITSSTSIIACSYSASNTETLTIPNTQVNKYYVLMVTNYSGQSGTFSITSTQGGNNILCPTNAPSADFQISNSLICPGQSVSLTDMSVPSGSITSWKYISSTASPTTSTVQNPTFTFNTPGTHSISLTVSTSNSLTSTITKTIQVSSLPSVTITPSNTTICNGASQALTANGPGPLSYFWSSGSTTPSITVTPTTTTSYTVTASNSFGCQNTFTTTVNVANTPSVSISSPSTNVCTGYTMAVSAMGATNYTWSTGATTNTTIVQPFFSNMYNVIGSNGGACSDTAFLSITTLPLPTVSATASQTMACVGQTVNLIGVGNAAQYIWNPGLLIGQNQTVQILAPITYSLVGQGTNGCANYSTVFINANNNSVNIIPVVTPSVVCLGDSAMLSVIGGTIPIWGANSSTFVAPTAPTNYTVNAVDLNGCNSNVVFHVGFDPDCGVTVYNGFTPNGDGINDYFFIENIYKFPNNNVHIFNRWGNKLISFSRYNNATNKWDGKVNGNVVASGTYYFLITNDNDKVLKKGWVEITN
jgi:gliding motility-associated-like protein